MLIQTRKLCVSFMLLLLALPFFFVKDVHADTIYTVDANGNLVLYGTSGSSVDFDSFLMNLQKNIIDSVKGLDTGTLHNGITVVGGLDYEYLSGGYAGSLWSTITSADVGGFKESTEGHYVYLRNGSDFLKVYVPQGKIYVVDYKNVDGVLVASGGHYEYVNQKEIAKAQELFKRYADVVKQSVAVGSMAHAFNVYTFYPSSRQVYLKDLIEFPSDGSEGKLKANSSISYSLDYLMHPFRGRMKFSEVQGVTSWETTTGLPTPTTNKERVTFAVNENYRDFIISSEGRESLSEIQSTVLGTNSGGIKEVTSQRSKTKVSPLHAVDTTLRLAVPFKFSEFAANRGTYFLKDTTGYKLFDGVRLRVTTNEVYTEDENGNFKSAGDYAKYNIVLDSLVITKLEVDDDGKPSEGTSKFIGAVVPLRYKEAVFVPNVSSGVATNSEGNTVPIIDGGMDIPSTGKVYFTGRELHFRNDYATKATLIGTNQDIFAVYSITGYSDVRLLHYAFLPGKSDHTDPSNHTDFKDLRPPSFEISAGFYADETGYGGFVLFYNNYYVENQDLMSWLRSDHAKSMSGVYAEELLSHIKGLFEVEEIPLSYAEWNRLQEIRVELEETETSFLGRVIYVILLSFGILLSFYASLILMVYWIDRANFFGDFQLLGFLTFGRLNVSPGEIRPFRFHSEYPSEGGVTYATFGRMVVISLSLYALSVLCANAPWLISLFVDIYYTFMEWVGFV